MINIDSVHALFLQKHNSDPQLEVLWKWEQVKLLARLPAWFGSAPTVGNFCIKSG